MFSSLRSRLWLSYAVLIVLLLSVVAVALIFSLLQNPLVYRSVMPRLQAEQRTAMPLVAQALRAGEKRLQATLEAEASASALRLLVTNRSGQVIADSNTNAINAIADFNVVRIASLQDANRPGMVRDARRRLWLYSANEIATSGQYLIVAMELPRLTLFNVLRNEVISPIVIAGVAAILLSFLLAWIMANWIANPLQRMASAAQRLARGEPFVLPEDGPQEVKALSHALNDMNRQIQAGQQSQRDFVANVSHELKTPLTSIQGFAQAILDGTVQTQDALKDAANVIHHEAMRMYRLVLNLLTLARLEGGTADLQRTPVDLEALLRGVIERFGPLAKLAKIEINYEPFVLPVVIGDGDRLAQVFNNLVDNAIKFTPAGGEVAIEGRTKDGYAMIEVADNGKGIESADLGRIFDRFYQSDKSRRGGSERGVGLGLPIARQIVLAHGGEMWAESAPGKGSRFYVKLPLVKPEEATFTPRRSFS